jgi:hypothetical protein
VKSLDERGGGFCLVLEQERIVGPVRLPRSPRAPERQLQGLNHILGEGQPVRMPSEGRLGFQLRNKKDRSLANAGLGRSDAFQLAREAVAVARAGAD